MIGDIMTISRLRMGIDGKGVSTLVTFFDCPLHCKYCINNFCHKKDSYGDSVPRGAYTPEQLIQILRKDDIYYRMSGGGIVFGGGEPLLQSAFIHEVCKLADSAWKKRIETSLNVPWRYVEPIINDMDEWIIDIKDMDSRIYEEYTGVSIKELMDNIFRLKNLVDSSRLHIRIPRIPGFNNEKNVEESVKWIRDVLEVEPEVFDYFKPMEMEENQTLTIPPFLQ
ncbi:MAG: radical SAM protein [Lachnospiraceae bacterium]|nr:radical SAM protein [Lachnospiraceae bacterium]